VALTGLKDMTRKVCIKGLRDKLRSGRIPQISLSISTRIRKTLRERKQTWMDYQTRNDLIANESGRIHYHYTHMYIDYCIDEVSNRKYRERYM
jgi:hypothetical protein